MLKDKKWTTKLCSLHSVYGIVWDHITPQLGNKYCELYFINLVLISWGDPKCSIFFWLFGNEHR
jgi:hypothetical protein